MVWGGGQLFRITSENVYERGPLFFILPCVSFLYFIYSLLFIYLNNKKFTHSETFLFSLFFAVPAVFTIVQLKYLSFLTTWNSAAFIIIITYIFILNDQVYRDSLTGLENRLSFEHYCQKISQKKKDSICMIYIDIDNFKSINDQYGHFEGDKAIKNFADLIMDSFVLRRKRVMRFGGDEFIVIIEESPQLKIDACLERLNKNVKTFNENAEKPYHLDFSYGMGCFTDEFKDLNGLVDHIDHMMYINKQRKKDFYG